MPPLAHNERTDNSHARSAQAEGHELRAVEDLGWLS